MEVMEVSDNGPAVWVSRGIELRLSPDPRNFEARQDLSGNYWQDGGNDAFDNYGRVRFQHRGPECFLLQYYDGCSELRCEWLDHAFQKRLGPSERTAVPLHVK